MFLFAFLFHLLFAFLSSGNAEFMIMLPFLLMLYLASHYDFRAFSLIPPLTCAVFLWNMGMAIVPAHVYDLNRVDHQVEFTLKHQEDHLMWKNKPLVENILTYRKGFGYKANYMPKDSSTQALADSLVRHDIPLYTDFPNPGTMFSREDLINDHEYIHGRYSMTETDTWQNIYGENHIYLIRAKGD